MEITLAVTRHEALEVRRKRVGLTQFALAERAGLHPVYGAAVLRGTEDWVAGLDKLESALAAAEAEHATLSPS